MLGLEINFHERRFTERTRHHLRRWMVDRDQRTKLEKPALLLLSLHFTISHTPLNLLHELTEVGAGWAWGLRDKVPRISHIRGVPGRKHCIKC